MFITLLSRNRTLVAEVECKENQVAIQTEDKQLLSELQRVYRHNMSMIEFVQANYRLDRWKANGFSWELVISSEYHSQVV